MKYLIKQFVCIVFGCWGLCTFVFADNAPVTKDSQNKALSTEIKPVIVYKRKSEKNDYPIGASAHEEQFLKSMLGVNVQK